MTPPSHNISAILTYVYSSTLHTVPSASLGRDHHDWYAHAHRIGNMVELYHMQKLQALCFAKLAKEIDRFSPDAVASQLPPTQRNMLLLRLPVVDVIKLERTNVVQGIDMNTVWEKLFEQRVVSPCGILVGFPFNKSSFSFEGSWKEHYMAIVTSLLLNLYKVDFTGNSNYDRCIFNLLCCAILPYPRAGSPPIEYSIFTPDRLCDLDDTLNTPCKLASYLMQECYYRPKLVHISCNMFFHSLLWTERNSSVVSYYRTLKEFVSDTRKVVFSTDEVLMKKSEKDEGWELIERTRQGMVCQYVMEVILGSDDPKLESVCTDDKCPLWIAESIIKMVCKSLCDVGSYTSSVSKENLQKNVPYKRLKNISFSSAATDSYQQQLDSSFATSLTSAIEIQTGLETVHINRMPCDAHFTDTTGEEYFGEEEFMDLFSELVSLFKQSQFRSLELALTSILPTTLQEMLHSFFTTSSPNCQSLKLESIAVVQRNDNIPGTVAVPDSNDALMNKSLHLSHMELTPSLETLIFSYPLLSLESLALVDLTSISPSKSLEKAADLLHDMNNNSCLKKLVLKNIIFQHPNPQIIISALLQSSRLNHVEIEHVDIGPEGLVASLVNDISRLEELCVLKLVQLDLGKQSKQLFHQLCITILSLPRISDLSLDLSSNGLSLHHLTVVVDTWKQACSGVKLKELVISDNDLEPGQLSCAEHIVY